MNGGVKHGRAYRGIVERMLIRGKLVLETPAHLGSGEAIGLTDMLLLRDPLDGRSPLLTGASLAGALRNYLHEYERGYGQPEVPGELASRLFGRLESDASEQSWLIVDDARGVTSGFELRDGVTIDPMTRTAEEGKKYDVELLRAGTTFHISLELLLTGEDSRLVEALALALRGLQEGEIGLGMRKRRGLGRCRVVEWQVCRYDMTTPRGLLAWLDQDASSEQAGTDILALLDVAPTIADKREELCLWATFDLPSSLLIRSGWGGGGAPDMVHLRSYRQGGDCAILSGTSVAGAMRARALRIANTIYGREEDNPLEKRRARTLVDGMFGRRIGGRGDEPSGSRVVVQETELARARDLN